MSPVKILQESFSTGFILSRYGIVSRCLPLLLAKGVEANREVEHVRFHTGIGMVLHPIQHSGIALVEKIARIVFEFEICALAKLHATIPGVHVHRHPLAKPLGRLLLVPANEGFLLVVERKLNFVAPEEEEPPKVAYFDAYRNPCIVCAVFHTHILVYLTDEAHVPYVETRHKPHKLGWIPVQGVLDIEEWRKADDGGLVSALYAKVGKAEYPLPATGGVC